MKKKRIREKMHNEKLTKVTKEMIFDGNVDALRVTTDHIKARMELMEKK